MPSFWEDDAQAAIETPTAGGAQPKFLPPDELKRQNAKPSFWEDDVEDAPLAKTPKTDSFWEDDVPGLAKTQDTIETVTESTPGAVKLPSGGYAVPVNGADLPEELRQPSVEIKAESEANPYVQSFMSGLNKANADLARIPVLAYDAFALPQNIVEKVTGWKVGAKSPDWMIDNPLATHFDKASESYNYKAKAYEGENLVSLVNKKEYGKAADYLAHSVIENIPTQMTIILGALSGAGELQVLGTMGAMQAAGKNKEARDEGLDSVTGTASALISGGFEAIFERAGTFGLLKEAQEIFKTLGKATGREILKASAKVVFNTSIGEGNEEFNTSLAQDFTDSMMGVKKVSFKEAVANAVEAAAVGSLSGVSMTAPSAATAGLQQNKINKAVETIKQAQAIRGQSVDTSDMQNAPGESSIIPEAPAPINIQGPAPETSPAIAEAEKAGKVIGIDAETKLPVIDTKQAPAEKPVEVKVRKPSKPKEYDTAKAAQERDIGTLIKAHGKFSYPGHLAGEIGHGTQRRKSMGKLFPFMRKGAAPLDKLLQELKGQYPDIFNQFETDADLLKYILDKNPLKLGDNEDKLIQEAISHEERTAELTARAKELGATDADIERAKTDVQEELKSEVSLEEGGGDVSFDPKELEKEGFSLESGKAPEVTPEPQADIFGGQKSYRKTKFGEKKNLQDQSKEATSLQQAANDENQNQLFDPSGEYSVPVKDYSAVEKSAQEKLPASFTPEQALNTIKNTPGVKQEEISWLGLEEWLDEQSRSAPSTNLQGASDSVLRHTNRLSDLVKTSPFEAKGFGSLDVPTKTAMLKEVFAAAQDSQVRQAIISAIPVDVMDILATKKLSADRLFDDESVFLKLFPVSPDTNVPIPVKVASSMINAAASQATKTTAKSSDLTRLFKNGLSADKTINHRHNPTLPQQRKISKQELLDFIRSNQVEIKEVVKSDLAKKLFDEYNAYAQSLVDKYSQTYPGYNLNSLVQDGILTNQEVENLDHLSAELKTNRENLTKFQNYVLPGGENYREVLLTLPVKKVTVTEKQAGLLQDADEQGRIPLTVDVERIKDEPSFKSSHFDEPNVLAHFRLNDRTDSQDKKTLFIEEVQADSMQLWRKLQAKIDAGEKLSESEQSQYDTLNKFPFKKSWHELALKRILRMAVDEGYDAIAWTTGEQQAERYDLSKQIDSLKYIKQQDGNYRIGIIQKGSSKEWVALGGLIKESELADNVGKDLANKIINGEGEQIPHRPEKMFSGVDLKVGGEGMKGFYDQIIPQFLNKYTRKWGGRVSETKLDIPGNEAIISDKGKDYREKVHSLEITPSMRESILMTGQTLFDKGVEEGYRINGEELNRAYGSKENYVDALRRGGLLRLGKVRRQILQEFSVKGYVPVIGKEVATPQDAAEITSVYRNPSHEIFQIVYLKNGKVVAHHAHSLNIPGYVLLPQPDVFAANIKARAASLGADSVIISHNHPSGNHLPSTEDIDYTYYLSRHLGRLYNGHVIMNGGNFTFIDKNNVASIRKYSTPKETFPTASESALKEPEHIALAIKDNFKKGKANVVFMDSAQRIVAFEYIDAESRHIASAIAEKMRAYKASRYAIVIEGPRNKYVDPDILSRFPAGMLDVVLVDSKGNYVDSAFRILGKADFKAVGRTMADPFLKGELKGMPQGGVGVSGRSIATESVHAIFEPEEEYGGDAFDESQENLDSTESAETQKERKEFKLFERSKEIIRKYAERVGERFVPRGAVGMFFPKTNNIRLMALNNLSTVTHEVTHYLDQKHKLVQNLINSTGKGHPIRKRLTSLYVEHYPGGKKNHKLKVRMAEGIAMLFQKYVENPKQIEADYPELVNKFLKEGGQFYKPEFGEFLKDAGTILQDFEALDPTEQIGARIADSRQKIVKDSYFNFMDKVAEWVADAIYPLEKLGKIAGTAWTSRDPSLWLRQYKNSSAVIMNNLKGSKGYWSFRSGKLTKLFDYNWKTLVDTLHKKGEIPLFGRWLVARRQHFGYLKLDELTQNIRSAAEEFKLSQEEGDPEAVKAAMENFKAVSDGKASLERVLRNDNFKREVVTKVYEEHKDRFAESEKMFDSMVKADLELLADPEVMLVTPDQYSELSQNEGYATFKRDVYDDIIGDGGAPLGLPKVGGVKASSMMQRTGSELSILNPLYGSLLNHAEITRKALKQIVYNKMLPLSDQLPDLFQRVPLKAHVESDGSISFPQEHSLKESLIMARENYKRVPIQTDKGVKKVLDDVLTYKNVDLARELIITMNRTFTKGTTGSYPPFALVNLFVDQITAAAQTRNKYTPIYDTLRTFAKALQNNDSPSGKFLEEYLVLGGERQTLVGWQDMQPDELFRKIQGEKEGIEKVADWLEKGYDILALPSKWSEIATRASEYIKARQAGKDQLVALEEAGRVTAPFHHVGSWGGSELAITWVKGIPFANATIQVLSEYTATLSDPKRQKRAMVVLGMVTASLLSSMAALLTFGDDEDKEDYKSLEPQELANYLWLPNPFGKGLLKFRIPSQMGAFGTVANMFLADTFLDANYKIGDYVDAATAWIPDQFNFLDPVRVSLSWIPQLAKPFLEAVVFEKKTYPKVRDIESKGLQYHEPRARYYDTTSSFAKYVGNLLNLSPIKIDYLLEGYLGRVTRFFTGKGVQNPFVKDFYFTAGRNLQDYYDTKDDVMQKYNAIKNSERPFTDKEKLTVLRNRMIIFGDKDVKGIDDLLKVYRDQDKSDKSFKDKKEAENLRTAILNRISQLK